MADLVSLLINDWVSVMSEDIIMEKTSTSEMVVFYSTYSEHSAVHLNIEKIYRTGKGKSHHCCSSSH